MSEISTDPILVFVTDLYFTIRIERVAESLGYETETAEELHGQPAALLLFDLDHPQIDWLEIMGQARSEKSLYRDIPILAFGSHVRGENLLAARTAGANLAVAKSRFMQDMQHLFESLLNPG